MATGVAHRLKRSGLEIIVLEIPQPTVIRRKVAFGSAAFEGEVRVEGIAAKLVDSVEEALEMSKGDSIPVLLDPDGSCIGKLAPDAVVDCILAKKNLGTRKAMAPIVVGVGPGFEAGNDVHAVVETKRGHDLGKVIYEGSAFPDTGIPGNIGGYTIERVIKAPGDGILRHVNDIGSIVSPGDIICTIDGLPVTAAIGGVVRGLIKDGMAVKKGLKIGDIDPRGIKDYCFTISDKARSVGGGVLEAILYLRRTAQAV